MTHRRILRIALAALVVTPFLAACGDDDEPTTSAAPSTTVAVPTPSVRITAPADRATVSSPFKVTMSASNFVIEPAGAVREGAGHFHVMADVGCVPPGTAIPVETAGYSHFGKAQMEGELTLEPGEHRLCLQPGNGAHIALPPTHEITVTVVK